MGMQRGVILTSYFFGKSMYTLENVAWNRLGPLIEGPSLKTGVRIEASRVFSMKPFKE